MSQSREIENVALDDADLDKRNEALIIDNEALREQLLDQEDALIDMAKRVGVMRGVQQIGIVNHEEVRKLFTAIEAAIESFIRPMDQLIRYDKQHKDRIMKALDSKNSFADFRHVLRVDPSIRAAAINPLTSIVDIWSAYIWRLLHAKVFDNDAILKFYSNEAGGQNVTYYVRNLDELDNLMNVADPPVFGRYARRLWKRQALAAIFRTAKFDWVENNRAASIASLSDELLKAFTKFTRPMPEGRPLDLIRNIVVAAVELNEHIMIEADDIWTVRMWGTTSQGEAFYDNMEKYDLKPVGTTVALRDNSPLKTIKDRLSLEVIRQRVKPLCVVSPALRFEHIEADGNDYQDTVDLVEPRVLVALEQLPAAKDEREYAAAEADELVFYTLAQKMELVQ